MWSARRNRVKELIEWVEERAFEEGKARRLAPYKAAQYVYANLMIGKMYFPRGDDPLFTSEFYYDKTLGKLKDAEGDAIDLQEFYHVANKPLQFSLITEDYRKAKKECLGEHDCNLSAAVSQDFVERNNLKNYVECFASEDNHVLRTYFTALGDGEGNFFAFAQKHDYVLPQGAYYMNPPFIEEFYEELYKIVEKSHHRASFFIVFPNWRDMVDPWVRLAKHVDGFVSNPMIEYNRGGKRFYQKGYLFQSRRKAERSPAMLLGFLLDALADASI